MDEFSTEEEQLLHIKQWIKENGPSIAVGLVLGVSVILGGRAWFDYQDKQAGQAAAGYAQIIEAVSRSETELVLEKGTKLRSEYASTPYAALAAMAMARSELEGDNVELAQSHLSWAVENAKPDSYTHVARQRLIRTLLADGKLDEAEQLLNEFVDKETVTEYFSAAYKGLQGDLYMARGDFGGAGKAYQAAVDGLPQGVPYRVLMELKRDSVMQPGNQE